MPKKLLDCVEKVKASGKSESEAWAICIKSTGLKPHNAEIVNKIVALANDLDEAGFVKEAELLDKTLVCEAQWQWLREKEQQFKDWVSTEKEMDPALRQILTTLRQNHWNLIKQINSCRKMLNKVWENMGKPVYIRDLNNAIGYLQREISQAVQKAKEASESARTLQQQQQQPVPDTLSSQFDEEQTQVIGPEQQVQTTGNVNFLEKLLRVANTLEAKGEQSFAHEIDNIFFQQVKAMATPLRRQSAIPPMGEWGKRLQDWFGGKISPALQTLSKMHWDLMDKLNSAYNKLQVARQNISNPNMYVDIFLNEVDSLEQDLNEVLKSTQQIGQVAREVATTEQGQASQQTQQTPEVATTPAQQPSTEQGAVPQPITPITPDATPADSPTQAPGGEPAMPPRGGVAETTRPSLKSLTPEQRQQVMDLIYQYRKQNKGQGA